MGFSASGSGLKAPATSVCCSDATYPIVSQKKRGAVSRGWETAPRLEQALTSSESQNSPADAAVAAIRPLSLPGPFARTAEVVSDAGLEESEHVITEEKTRLPGH